MARPGVIGAWGACVASIAYGIPQILQVLHLLPDPIDRILIFAPSLALAPLFVLALAGAYAQTHHHRHERPWRIAALAMALLYAGSVSKVYVIQLATVIPRELAGLPPVAGFDCCAFQGPMVAVDLLGYTYMGLATLLLIPSFRGATAWALAANSVLTPFIFFQLWWPGLIWLAAPWLVTFPVAMALMAIDLSRHHPESWTNEHSPR